MVPSIWRIVGFVLRVSVGAGLALVGAGLLRQDPRVPAAIVNLATQSPFGGLWWALVSLAGGTALILHALPSPWWTERPAQRGLRDTAPVPEPTELVTADRPPVMMSVPAASRAPGRVAADPEIRPQSPQPTETGPDPVFRSRPLPRHPSRARRIGPARA